VDKKNNKCVIINKNMIDEKTLIKKKKQLEAEFEKEKAKAVALEQTIGKAETAYGAIKGKMAKLQAQWKLIDELLKK